LAGFRAYSIGGFALVGARYALPDVGVARFGEMAAGVRDVMQGSRLPVLVDADDGSGDVKNATRTIQICDAMGVAAVFIEDQVAPKRCGHMAGKSVVPVEQAVPELEAALAARRNGEFTIIAAGLDGAFIEAPTSIESWRPSVASSAPGHCCAQAWPRAGARRSRRSRTPGAWVLPWPVIHRVCCYARSRGCARGWRRSAAAEGRRVLRGVDRDLRHRRVA
jgi:hypothetical protein